MVRTLSLLSGSLALFLAACAVAPPAGDPLEDIDIPGEWAAPASTTESSDVLDVSDPEAEPWWTHFADPRLEALVEEALAHNYDLRAAAAAVEAAWAQARIAGADLAPQVAGGLGAATREQVFVGLPIPGQSGPITSRSDSFNLNLEVSWEADLWGRLRAGQSAATRAAAAARADFEAARLGIVAQTARAWFTLLEAERQLELAEQTLESRAKSLERVDARYRRGVGAALDVRLARTNAAQARSAVAIRRRQLDASQRQLEILLGRYPRGLVEAASGLPEIPPLASTPLPAELVTRRPDLRAAERRLEAAGYRVVEARRALYPRLSFAASGGTTSNRVADLLDSDFTAWNLAGNLLAPLFQGGRLRAAAEFAAASRERVLAQYVRTVLRAFAEVESALAAERFLAAEEAALATSAEEAAAAARLAEKRYTAGLGNYLDLLESQRRVFEAEVRHLAVQRQRLVNRVDLCAALGG